MKLLAVDSNNKQSKSLKDYNKYITKVRLVYLIFTFQFKGTQSRFAHFEKFSLNFSKLSFVKGNFVGDQNNSEYCD